MEAACRQPGLPDQPNEVAFRAVVLSTPMEKVRMDMSESKSDVNVVLVHGAWADGSSWTQVIKPLQSRGLRILAAPIPLTSLSDDVAALERAL